MKKEELTLTNRTGATGGNIAEYWDEHGNLVKTVYTSAKAAPAKDQEV